MKFDIRDHGVGAGLNINGRQVIDIHVQSTQPINAEVGDVWVKATKDISNIVFRAEEPNTPSLNSGLIKIGGDTDSVVLVQPGMEFIGNIEKEVTIGFPSLGALEKPSPRKTKFWENPYMSLYAQLGAFKSWDGSEWIYEEAFQWDGAEWTQLSKGDFYTYITDPHTLKALDGNGNVVQTSPVLNNSLDDSWKYIAYRDVVVGNEMIYIVGQENIIALDKTLDVIWKKSYWTSSTYTYTNIESGAVDKDDNLFFGEDHLSSMTTGRLRKFDKNGTELWLLGGSKASYSQLVTDIEGNVYAQYDQNHGSYAMNKYSPEGDLIWSISYPGTVDILSSGEIIWIGGNIAKFDPINGSVIKTTPKPDGFIETLTAAKDGTFYIAGRGLIYKYDKDLNLISSYNMNMTDYVFEHFSVDPNGNIFAYLRYLMVATRRIYLIKDHDGVFSHSSTNFNNRDNIVAAEPGRPGVFPEKW